MADGMSALGGKLYNTTAEAGFTPYGIGNTKDPNNLFAGPVAASGVKTGTKAGYYRLPGSSQAIWVDPSTGSVPKEFVEQNLGDKDLIGGDPAAVFKSTYSQSPGFMDTMQKTFDLEKTGLSPQEAQDQITGSGSAQKFVIGPNGEHINMSTINDQIATRNTPGYVPPTPGFKDVSGNNSIVGGGQSMPPASGLRALSAPGAAWSQSEVDATKGISSDLGRSQIENEIAHGRVDAARKLLGNNQALDKLNTNNQRSAILVASKNIKEGGDWQGISAEKTAANTSTYGSITSDEGKSAWLRGQDPGNLSPELRAEQQKAIASENSIYSPGVNDKWSVSPTGLTGQMINKDLSKAKGDFEILYGDITTTDPNTGRSIVHGNVPKDLKYKAPEYDPTNRAMHGLKGGIIGGLTTGSPWGALLGAYMGAGGPMPTSGLDKKFGNWKAQNTPMNESPLVDFIGGVAGMGFGLYGNSGGMSGMASQARNARVAV